jgi:hypothetical protein
MSPQTQNTVTVDGLLDMNQPQLDELFRGLQPGPIPNGEAKGTAIIAPGTRFTKEIASFINHFGWQGKTFDGSHGVLSNRILAFGLNAIIAEVYKDKSWFDGGDCIVLDYSKTSILAHWVRDEVRQIRPGFYLGIVYWEKTKLIDFCLEFPQPA